MSDRAFVATRKGLFTLDRKAGRWQISATAFLGDSCPMVLPDPRDAWLYAALGHGHFGSKLHRSSDHGRTWEECGVPTYPPKPEGLVDINPMNHKPVPWSLELIWALEAADPQQPGALWCGTLPGGLFFSPDRGSTWELNRPLWDAPARREWFGGGYDFAGIHSICVDPRDARRLTVGVSCGGVFRSDDAGASWRNVASGMRAAYMPPERACDPSIQDPHRVVQCAARPDVFWSQHHNGVFRSTDDCGGWHELADVPPSVFGFAVAVHPRDPDTAWLVPAIKDEKRIPVDGRVVVTRTQDGGKSWQVLRAGLPQAHAYDLVYRHALDVDESGQRLIFGSTTGSLWMTEDGGDSWQTISTHLPPIHCTRFAPPT